MARARWVSAGWSDPGRQDEILETRLCRVELFELRLDPHNRFGFEAKQRANLSGHAESAPTSNRSIWIERNQSVSRASCCTAVRNKPIIEFASSTVP